MLLILPPVAHTWSAFSASTLTCALVLQPVAHCGEPAHERHRKLVTRIRLDAAELFLHLRHCCPLVVVFGKKFCSQLRLPVCLLLQPQLVSELHASCLTSGLTCRRLVSRPCAIAVALLRLSLNFCPWCEHHDNVAIYPDEDVIQWTDS